MARYFLLLMLSIVLILSGETNAATNGSTVTMERRSSELEATSPSTNNASGTAEVLLTTSAAPTTPVPGDESGASELLTTESQTTVTYEVTTQVETTSSPEVRTETDAPVAAVGTGAPDTSRPKSRSDQDWFPVLMLTVGLLSIIVALGLVARRVMLNRRPNGGQEFPMSFSNPIYDVALASLRTGGSEGIAEAEDAMNSQQYGRLN